MPTWVRSYFAEDDITFVWEVGDDGWISRSVELVEVDRHPRTAASLEEVIRARDSGGIDAVRGYEARYGVLPEKPIGDWDFPHENITHAEFEQVWEMARRAVG